jgi:hypothetical protein
MRTSQRRNPLSLPLLILSLASAAIAGCTPGSPGSPAPAATQPVALALTPADPVGTPAPAGAPFMFTKVLKFSIPSRTIFEVAVEGWMLRESSVTQCGNDGCYSVLSRNDDGSQTTYVIQVWPQAYKRFAHQAEFQITDVSLNSNVTGEQRASKPLKLIILEAISPTLGGPPSPASVLGSAEWAANNEVDALQYAVIGLSSEQDAKDYYKAVDPADSRTTLTAWKQVNGFGPDDSQDDAKADYFNAGDLGLGRSMHMKLKSGGDIAYYVSNYPTVADAVRRTNLIATVAMEYTEPPPPAPPGGQRFVKYFVYGNDDTRALSADLDGNGQKYVPNLCTICHGLDRYTAGPGGTPDVRARFLPFDLQSFQYDQTVGRASQEAEFKKLNLAILQSNKSVAEDALINAWYQDVAASDLARQTQNDDAVPGGWAGQERLYLDVVRPSCRACHVSRDPGKDLGTFAFFDGRASAAHTYVCNQRSMPNAKVSYEKFWLQRLPQPYRNQVGLINRSSVTGWNTTIPCPD